MSRRMYRVCRARYARLDGAGARLVGGRWNSAGRSVVYMAESISLAVLENLVHMSRQDFPSGYVCVQAVLPDSVHIATEQALRLRADLRESCPQALGDWWIDAKESAVLAVASAVVPLEHTYLLNPAHGEFAKIAIDPPALFHFDPRLFR
jgi:RES domain-containing protein